MKAYDAFQQNCLRTKGLLSAYEKLAGGSGRNHRYCSDVLRSIIAHLASSIDSYFHDKVMESIEIFIRVKTANKQNPDLPKNLRDLILKEVSLPLLIKYAQNNKPVRSIRNRLEKKIFEDTLQHPGSIQAMLDMIELHDFWDMVAAETTELSEQEVKDYLAELVRRRNKIVHEGDMMRDNRRKHKLRVITKIEILYWIEFTATIIDIGEHVINEHMKSLA